MALKELCPEDKRRVRQLIEDLARVGTERELIQHRLKKEKRQFEERLTRMKYQQQSLARERHDIRFLFYPNGRVAQKMHEPIRSAPSACS